VLKQAGDQARAYQDAERAYRAALARQQQLAGDADTPTDQTNAANAAVKDTANKFAAAEAALRERAPAYLELLNPQASAAICRRRLAITRPICASSPARRAAMPSWSTRPACILSWWR